MEISATHKFNLHHLLYSCENIFNWSMHKVCTIQSIYSYLMHTYNFFNLIVSRQEWLCLCWRSWSGRRTGWGRPQSARPQSRGNTSSLPGADLKSTIILYNFYRIYLLPRVIQKYKIWIVCCKLIIYDWLYWWLTYKEQIM